MRDDVKELSAQLMHWTCSSGEKQHCGCPLCEILHQAAATIARLSAENEAIRTQVLMWLGGYRDDFSPKAIAALQYIVGSKALEGTQRA